MRSHPVLAAVAVALALAAACSSSKEARVTHLDGGEARQLLIDRNWIDRMPQTHRDKLHVFRFVPSMGGGVFQDRTLFKGIFELFVFEVTGDEIRFNLPETNQKVRSRYTIEAVDGPAPFDLRLTIAASPRGPEVYYGIRAETDRDGHLLESKLAALRAAR